MGSLRSALLLASLLLANGATAEEVRVTGVDGHTLTLHLKAKVWPEHSVEAASATFTANGKTFPLYGTDIGVEVLPRWLSPDRKTLLVNQTMYGMLSDGSGEDSFQSRSYCDVISMETGCVLLQRDDQFCAGKWVGNSWTTDEGEVLKPEMETPSPQALLKTLSNIESAQYRASEIEWSLIMGADSYMACHPPARNVQGLNDLGFFLAEGGNDALALKFYRGVEAVGKRTVLMLNIADSLWRLDRKDEAQRYYSQYRDAMSADGKAQKIPQRVVERSVIQGMKH
ncbi:tetratricopeptide repeat protein [Pseudomonas sp. SDO52101_S400]